MSLYDLVYFSLRESLYAGTRFFSQMGGDRNFNFGRPSSSRVRKKMPGHLVFRNPHYSYKPGRGVISRILLLYLQYLEMVYRKSVKTAKRNFKKKGAGLRKRTSYKKNSLVSLIKKISLKNSETKYNHISSENIQLFHNGPNLVNNLLACTQGITDNGAGTNVLSNRIGDEVIGRGISLKMWIANKLDRPNVMFRLVVYKYQSQTTPASINIFKTGSGNKIMDDIDKEYITVVYQKIFNLQVGYSAFATGTGGDTDGREAHTYRQVWIPLKNKKIHYNDGGSIPKFINYGFMLLPYDSFGTLTTDNIASYTYQYKYYFKDP